MAAFGQSIESTYNRDTEEPFKLKDVKVESTVVGPLVRTSTLLTYSNPFKSKTEASLTFNMPDEAALSGFAYYYGDEYVKGRLMDKAKAWFIYTAITSRGEDPGVMDQWAPTRYHCQIYPIMIGHDLKVRLYTVGFLKPNDGKLFLPRPDIDQLIGAGTSGVKVQTNDWSVRTVDTNAVTPSNSGYSMSNFDQPVRAVAQRFRDGRTYVAGIVRSGNGPGEQEPTFDGIEQPRWVALDDQTMAFMGWLRHNHKIALRHNGTRYEFRPERIYGGSEAARLWAQQMLASDAFKTGAEVLKFSLKYGIPSTKTALLAVPSKEMSLFRRKEHEYQAKEAADRRDELAADRDHRGWESKRGTNWNNSGGGDPEIRLHVPGATRARAYLPDGRVIDLAIHKDELIGNFEIPANAPEGGYQVRVEVTLIDGKKTVIYTPYDVDRTPPKGTFKTVSIEGIRMLEVDSEPGLAEVAAYLPDGSKIVLKEVSPGIYRAPAPAGKAELVIVLKDKASNKGEIRCSLDRS